jgi:hypothetical protein
MTRTADPASEHRGQELALLDHRIDRTQHSPGLVDDWHGDFQIPISLFVETQLPHP